MKLFQDSNKHLIALKLSTMKEFAQLSQILFLVKTVTPHSNIFLKMKEDRRQLLGD